MSARGRTRSFLSVMCGGMLALGVAVVATPPSSAQTSPVTHAAFTTINPKADGDGELCLNGNGLNNCNLYTDKSYVWLSGGPLSAALGDGTYFFAVLAPGGQADPNDGSNHLLSTDTYQDRTFSIADGTVTDLGTHGVDSNKIRLAPYADTPNHGGVYIMAICSLGGGQPVDPSTCKYDAFKVRTSDTGTDNPASELTVTKDAAGAYDTTYTWGIKKDVDKTEVDAAPGGTASFGYTVSVTHDSGTNSAVTVAGTIDVQNPNYDSSLNTEPVELASLTDTLSDGTSCEIDGSFPATLTSFDNLFSYSCALDAVPTQALANDVTAGWDAQQLEEGNLAAGSANFTFADIAFAQTVVDGSVDVTDTFSGGTPTELGTVSATDASPTAFTYTKQVSGDDAGTCTTHDNTATATTNTNATAATASRTVQVCVGADPTVMKTATPAYHRSYGWQIAKSVDKPTVRQSNGSARVNYAVTASQTGYTDSGWTVDGAITVTNPNDWEPVTVDVTDVLDSGGDCVVTGGDQVTVAAKGSAVLNYSCSTSGAHNTTNRATASWDPVAAHTSHSSAQGTAAVIWGGPTSTTNKTVTVTDSYNGLLGTATANDAAPYAATTFSYPRDIAVPDSGCQTFPNTATITETGQSASASVQACRTPGVTGALTIGFWQNKNGQAIITGGASTAGVCKSGTWLRQYAPFQDLSATARCSAVASYVSVLVKNASAAGAAMNAMLRAQMMATALDVYFSDPALGQNKIGASAPIGGLVIDLLHSTGATQNASAAFGGATSLTVTRLLACAAAKSNAGGTSWYGQVKATQELAKNTFDSINNQWAYVNA